MKLSSNVSGLDLCSCFHFHHYLLSELSATLQKKKTKMDDHIRIIKHQRSSKLGECFPWEKTNVIRVSWYCKIFLLFFFFFYSWNYELNIKRNPFFFLKKNLSGINIIDQKSVIWYICICKYYSVYISYIPLHVNCGILFSEQIIIPCWSFSR